MFRIVGIACLITLLTPTLYLLKYFLHDHPQEVRIAKMSKASYSSLSSRVSINDTDWYIENAEGKDNVQLRTLAVNQLTKLASSTEYQMTYPVECLRAKLAIEQVASTDPDPTLRGSARTALIDVAKHGAVIAR